MKLFMHYYLSFYYSWFKVSNDHVNRHTLQQIFYKSESNNKVIESSILTKAWKMSEAYLKTKYVNKNSLKDYMGGWIAMFYKK